MASSSKPHGPCKPRSCSAGCSIGFADPDLPRLPDRSGRSRPKAGMGRPRRGEAAGVFMRRATGPVGVRRGHKRSFDTFLPEIQARHASLVRSNVLEAREKVDILFAFLMRKTTENQGALYILHTSAIYPHYISAGCPS